MMMPKYVADCHAEGLSPVQKARAVSKYRSRLIRQGIRPEGDLWRYFVEEQIVSKTCQLDFVVDIKGDCSISLAFCDPVEDTQCVRHRKVRFSFHGIEDIECALQDNGKRRSRKFLGSSIWKRGKRFYLRLLLSSGAAEPSIITFSYAHVWQEM